MPHPLCELCAARPAVVFITQVVDNTTKKGRYCEVCARAKASGEGWLAQLAQDWGDESEAFSDALRTALEQVPLEEILLELFEMEDAGADELEANLPFYNEFEEDGFGNDKFGDKSGANNDFALSSSDAFETDVESGGELEERRVASERCPNCLTTWDTIKRDGRVGCSACYAAFHEAIGEVMGKVQRGESHLGKIPRAAQKRGRRVKNLQTRRENQLQLLRNRLQEAVAAEKYEEAAKLRDKIKAAVE